MLHLVTHTSECLTDTDKIKETLLRILSDASIEALYNFFQIVRESTKDLSDDEFEVFVEQVSGQVLPWKLEVQPGSVIQHTQGLISYLVSVFPEMTNNQEIIGIIDQDTGHVIGKVLQYYPNKQYALGDFFEKKEDCLGYRV